MCQRVEIKQDKTGLEIRYACCVCLFSLEHLSLYVRDCSVMCSL